MIAPAKEGLLFDAAGIKALALLNAREFSIVLNTARFAAEVKDGNAYSLAAGVVEHGSSLWDAVHQREQIPVSADANRSWRSSDENCRAFPECSSMNGDFRLHCL